MGRTADTLVNALMFDMFPSPGACVDYGLDNGDVDRRFRALRSAIMNGVTADMLHAASVNGGGPALTTLIRENNPDKDVVFTLVWDDMPKEDDE